MTRYALALLLVASMLPAQGCVIAIGKWKVSSYGEETKEPASSKDKGARIVEKVQRQVAVHEAAHAVAMAILFGVDEVDRIVVNTRIDDDGYRGVTYWDETVRNRYTLDLNRKSAVVSLAARSADALINEGPQSGSSSDLQHANEAITNSYISWGLGGTPMTFDSRADAPKWMRKRILADLLDAESYADEIVKANLEVIKELADDVMGMAEKDDKHLMPHDVFKAFCDTHALVDPRAPPKALPKEAK